MILEGIEELDEVEGGEERENREEIVYRILILPFSLILFFFPSFTSTSYFPFSPFLFKTLFYPKYSQKYL